MGPIYKNKLFLFNKFQNFKISTNTVIFYFRHNFEHKFLRTV